MRRLLIPVNAVENHLPLSILLLGRQPPVPEVQLGEELGDPGPVLFANLLVDDEATKEVRDQLLAGGTKLVDLPLLSPDLRLSLVLRLELPLGHLEPLPDVN